MTTHPALEAGKVAVITGAAGGIGLAAARAFKKLGLRVCIADLGSSPLLEAAAELGDALAVPVDVSDRSSVDALASAVADQLGPVAVLMNNAGIGGGGDALSNLDRWRKIIDVNLMGVLHGIQSFVPGMIAHGGPGLVINTGSKQGITQPPGDTAYNVSKAGVKALTEGLAHTLRTTPNCQVEAHLLIPGFTYTGMVQRRIPERPASAWTPEQVVERLLEGVASREFYILCQDNETTREQDERRILWAAEDITQNRPALSRWHPDWKDRYEAFVSGS